MNHEIAAIKAEIRRGHDRIAEIRAKCSHDWQPSIPGDPTCSSPVCSRCQETKSGWWCEASPTKECDYERQDGRGYNPDSCRYCHQPDERK